MGDAGARRLGTKPPSIRQRPVFCASQRSQRCDRGQPGSALGARPNNCRSRWRTTSGWIGTAILRRRWSKYATTKSGTYTSSPRRRGVAWNHRQNAIFARPQRRWEHNPQLPFAQLIDAEGDRALRQTALLVHRANVELPRTLGRLHRQQHIRMPGGAMTISIGFCRKFRLLVPAIVPFKSFFTIPALAMFRMPRWPSTPRLFCRKAPRPESSWTSSKRQGRRPASCPSPASFNATNSVAPRS